MRDQESCVVENRAQPCRGYVGGMARNASGWIGCGDVIRHVRPIGLRIREIRLMAAVAIRGWITRGVVAADMAVRAGVHHRSDCAGNRSAWRQHMRALQREARRRMVKLSVRPKYGVVASRTHGRREARGNVVRHTSTDCRRAVPRRLVATVAIRVRRRQVVVIPYMAVRAGDYFPCGG